MDENEKTSIKNTAADQCSRKAPKEGDVFIGIWLSSAGFDPIDDENVVDRRNRHTHIRCA